VEDLRCLPRARVSTWGVVVMALAAAARPVRAEPVTEYEAGRPVRVLDAMEAEQHGLTVLDLGDDFVPSVFRGDALHAAPAYAATYRALADEGDLPATSRAAEDRYLELYGIFPSFRVLAARLADEPRYACHGAVDDAPLVAYTKQIAAVAAPTGPLGPHARAGQTARADALRVVQQHLVCDALLTPDDVTGLFGARSNEALRVYQQRHMIVSWGVVDAATRATLLTAPRLLDFRAFLRALRERVVAASGLIEDGTARGVEEPVLGQLLDPPELRAMHAYAPLPNGAPDLVSRATDAAARALGVLGPEEAARFVGARHHARAAVRLPPAPSYHSAHMALRAELDRGDVAHRTHRVIGDDPVAYRRMVRVDGALVPLSVDTRGFLYELDPPIPVQVLPGNVRGARKRPAPAAAGLRALSARACVFVGGRRHIVGRGCSFHTRRRAHRKRGSITSGRRRERSTALCVGTLLPRGARPWRPWAEQATTPRRFPCHRASSATSSRSISPPPCSAAVTTPPTPRAPPARTRAPGVPAPRSPMRSSGSPS